MANKTVFITYKVNKLDKDHGFALIALMIFSRSDTVFANYENMFSVN